MKKSSSNSKGFTLIELLVVIAIIGLLSTLAVVALNSARQKSRDAKRVADVRQIQKALELYFTNENSGYPVATAQTLGTGTYKALCAGGFLASCPGTAYMGSVPTPPSQADGSCTTSAYTYTGTVSTYSISFCLGSAVGDVPAGSRQATPAGVQ